MARVGSVSLVEVVANLGRSPSGITVCNRDGETTIAWAQFGERVRCTAAALQARGLEPSDHVLLVGDASVALVETIAGVILAGGAVSVMTVTSLRGRARTAAEVLRRARKVDARAVVLDGPATELDGLLRDERALWTSGEIADVARRCRPEAYEEVESTRHATTILQFTSGVTGEPHVVRVSNRSILAYFDAMDELNGFDATTETLVSWLPLGHDMGLIGYLVGALVTGADLFLASPALFVARPSQWLSWIARYPRVQSAAPSFAYSLLSRSPFVPEDIDLAGWRLAFNGGEPIRADDVERFCRKFAPTGFRRQSLACSYGLAEATLAVTADLDAEGPRWDVVNRDALSSDGHAVPVGTGHHSPEVLARLGRPLGCVSVRIADRATGEALPERWVGEVQVSGATVTDGYYDEPELAGELFDGPWLRTGDLGYLADGDLVVSARLKDVVIVAGRSIAPQQVEGIVEQHSRLRPGSVVAFGVPSAKGTEKLVLVATVPPRLRTEGLVRGWLHAIHRELGVTVGDVAFVSSGSIPRTASGKLQRQLCRHRYLEGLLD